MPALLSTAAISRVSSVMTTKKHVTATATSPDADRVQADTAAVHGANAVAEMEPTVLKAVRAFEHSKQRAKKSADTERARERKERKRSARAGLGAGSDASPAGAGASAGVRTGAGPMRTSRSRRSGGRGSVAADTDEDGDNGLGHDTELRDDFPSCPPAEELELLAGEAPAPPQEVDLSALIKPSKPSRRKAEDFELVPTVRAVIALDDHVPGTPELEEPWEHVVLEDEDQPAAPSYAQIVAATA